MSCLADLHRLLHTKTKTMRGNTYFHLCKRYESPILAKIRNPSAMSRDKIGGDERSKNVTIETKVVHPEGSLFNLVMWVSYRRNLKL